MKKKLPALKRVPGYSDIWVSFNGKVYRERSNGIFLLKSTPSHNGYLTVNIKGLGKKTRHRTKVSRLIAMAWIPNPYNYPVVMHLDNDITNNKVSNLQWGTQSDNMKQMVKDGRQRKSKIIDYLDKVITLRKQGFSVKEIMKVLNLSQTSTRRLLKKGGLS